MWMKCLYEFTTFYWLLSLFSCVLVVCSAYFARLHAYGKLRQERNAMLTVPKHWFMHFYVVGVSWCLVLLVSCFLVVLTEGSSQGVFSVLRVVLSYAPFCEDGQWQPEEALGHSVRIFISLTALLIHVCLRLYECIFVFKRSSAKMHVTGYLIGMSFYVAAPWSVVVGCSIWTGVEDTEQVSLLRYSLFGILYSWSSIRQHECHLILSRLNGYGLPRGSLFKYVSCPHYFTEILIYLSFMLLNLNESQCYLMISFVIINLSITADKTHSWYKIKFKEAYPTGRTAIIPYFF